tara:strand:+ start:1369 stop:1527 length:159 start_codon:yes stop_codon:yes gene_type:complete
MQAHFALAIIEVIKENAEMLMTPIVQLAHVYLVLNHSLNLGYGLSPHIHSVN